MQRGSVIGALGLGRGQGDTAGPVVAYTLLQWIELSGVYRLCAELFGLGTRLKRGIRARGIEGEAKID